MRRREKTMRWNRTWNEKEGRGEDEMFLVADWKVVGRGAAKE